MTFVCNKNWQCSDWSACNNGFQARQCDFVKVPQHVSDADCPSQDKPPIFSQKCEIQKQASLTAETCNDGVKNQNEENVDCGGVCKPCETNKNLTATEQKEGIKQTTGFATKILTGQSISFIATAVASFIVLVLSIFAGIKFYNRKHQ